MRNSPSVLLVLLAACDTDSGIKVTNTLPSASIVSPSDGASHMEQTTVFFSGTVGDANHNTEDLIVLWWSDGETICEATAPEADGTTTCDAIFEPGSAEVLLQVVDPVGGTAEDRVTIEIVQGDTPAVDILTPDGSQRYYASRPIEVTATVSDTEDGPSGLALAWESTLDGSLSLPETADSDGTVGGTVTLSEGDHELVLSATDSIGHIGTDRVPLTVVSENEAPSCGIVSPDAGSAWELGSTVTFEGTATDIHEAAGALAVSWLSDKDGDLGTSIADSDGTVTFSSDSLTINTHTVTLQVVDEVGELCTDSVVVAIGNRPEVTIEAPLNGEVVNEGERVTFSGTVFDEEDAAVDLSIAWESDVDSALFSNPPDSSGLTTFQTDALSTGNHIVTLTATDADTLEGRATVSFTVNGLPTAPVVELSPDPAATDDNLSAAVTTDATDPEGDSLTYSYVWSKGGVVQSSLTSSAVSSSLTAKGEIWLVEVQAYDGYGLGAAGSDSVTISNTAPVVSSVSFSASSVTTDDTLVTVVSGTDADGDSLSYSYTWSVGGTIISATGSTLDGTTWFDKGQTVQVAVVASDGTDTSSAVTASIVIDNSPPEVASVSLSPSAAYTDDTLSTSVGATSDADGDPVTLTYTWTVDGASTGSSGTSLSGSTYFSRDELVVVTVTPSDGTDAGSAVTDSVTVLNSPPTTPGVTITPSSPEEGTDDLFCEVTTASTDADGDAITYVFTWDADGTEYPDLDTGSTDLGPYTTTWTDDSVPTDDIVEDEEWICSAYADDGTDSSGDATDMVTIESGNTCGNGVVDAGEEYDPAPGPYSNISVDSSTCRWDFSDVDQLYCNGTCTWAGGSGCDQSDADILCQLITDNPLSTATSWTATTALATSGFSCPGYGGTVNVSGRGVSRSVWYYDSSILSTHGAGAVVAYPVCTDP